MADKAPFDSDQVSHGMCQACADDFTQQLNGLELGAYLDRFDLPVLVMSDEGRTLAANQLMADALGKSERELFGLLGGEVFECEWARLPEGCGQTTHCATCAMRIAITSTVESGEPNLRVEAYQTLARREPLVISTEPYRGGVLLTIHSL